MNCLLIKYADQNYVVVGHFTALHEAFAYALAKEDRVCSVLIRPKQYNKSRLGFSYNVYRLLDGKEILIWQVKILIP